MTWRELGLVGSLDHTEGCVHHSRLLTGTQARSGLPVLRADSMPLTLIICCQTKHFNKKHSLLGMIQEGSARRNLLLWMLKGLGIIEHLVGVWGYAAISQNAAISGSGNVQSGTCNQKEAFTLSPQWPHQTRFPPCAQGQQLLPP